jgi:hypothetical protein
MANSLRWRGFVRQFHVWATEPTIAGIRDSNSTGPWAFRLIETDRWELGRKEGREESGRDRPEEDRVRDMMHVDILARYLAWYE